MPVKIVFKLIVFLATAATFRVALAQDSISARQVNDRIIDSLEQVLQQPITNSQRVKALVNLAGAYVHQDSPHGEQALALAQEALSLSEKAQYPLGTFLSLQAIAGYYDLLSDYEAAEKFLLQSLEVATLHNLYEHTQDTRYGLLNLYFHLGDFTKAMKITVDGLRLAEEKKDAEKVARFTSLFGFIYLRQGNAGKAEDFYRKFFQQTRQIGDSSLIAESLEYLADVSFIQGELTRSLDYRLQAIEMYKKQFSKGRSLAKRYRLVNNLAELGRTYYLEGDYTSALAYCLQALNTKNIGINDYELAEYQIITGNVYARLGKFQKADSLLKQGLRLSGKIRHAENTRDAYASLSQLFAEKKQYDSALHYYQQYTVLKDSITNERSHKEIARIQTEYNVQKKDQEIALSQQKAETQKLIMYGIVAAFFSVLVMLYLLYNHHQLKQKAQFQEQLNQKQNELFTTITSIQDKERKRIAQDIHDQVGSVLSAAKLQLSGLEELKNQLTDGQTKTYASAMALMDQAAEELRNISHNLMPATLSRLGLVAALRGLFDKISEYSGLTIHFNAHGFENRLDEPIEINLYPMVLELINNVVKHARATEATVQLIRYPKYINISVEDNGKGFNVAQVNRRQNGIGMQNLVSRIELLKGSIDIDSREGKGTTVMVDIPIPG